jgi:hypothetical protein
LVVAATTTAVAATAAVVAGKLKWRWQLQRRQLWQQRWQQGKSDPKLPLASERYKNWNYCFTHGGDVDNNHTSAICAHPSENHQCAATGTNTMGGNFALHEQDYLPKRCWQMSHTNPSPTSAPQLRTHLQLPNRYQQATIPYCTWQLGFCTPRWSLPAGQQHSPPQPGHAMMHNTMAFNNAYQQVPPPQQGPPAPSNRGCHITTSNRQGGTISIV